MQGKADSFRLGAATLLAGALIGLVGGLFLHVETVLRRVDLRISLTVLGTGAIAVAVIRVLIEHDVNILVGQLPDARFAHLFLYLLLGCVIAVFASLNVRTINLVAALFQRARLPSAVRGALIGAAIGLLAWR